MRFEQSRGPDTALYKNLPLLFLSDTVRFYILTIDTNYLFELCAMGRPPNKKVTLRVYTVS